MENLLLGNRPAAPGLASLEASPCTGSTRTQQPRMCKRKAKKATQQCRNPANGLRIIRAYKGGQPNPQTQVVPSLSVAVSAKPTASAVGAPADAAPASFQPTYCAQEHLRVAHAVALRGKQLPLLPPGTIRVVFQPRGGLALNGAMAQPLIRALQVTAAGRDLGELHVRIHPTNNTFTVATSHEITALHLVQLKELLTQTTTFPVAAYIAPPPAAVRGVISQAYGEET
ncbi:hypothetical protein MTO96_015866 [Rhipicephalus appendiculatus]